MAEPPLLRPHVLGLAVAALVAAVSVADLAIPSLYERETEDWRIQAVVQDWVDLVLLAPLLAVSAWRLRSGSRAAAFVLAGGLMFTAYSFAIFSFAMHFNRMFLAYCATLGLAGLALVRTAVLLARSDTRSWFGPKAPVRLAGGLLAALGLLFLALWLSGDVPAMAADEPPAELAEVGLPANPVHVLDYSAVLPLHVAAGVALWRRHAFGFAAAPAVYVFGLVTDVAILGIQVASHEAGDPWTPTVMVAAVTALAAAALGLLLSSLRSPAARPTSTSP